MPIPGQFFRLLAAPTLALVPIRAAAALTLIEFFNPDLNDHFNTADPAEPAFVDHRINDPGHGHD